MLCHLPKSPITSFCDKHLLSFCVFTDNTCQERVEFIIIFVVFVIIRDHDYDIGSLITDTHILLIYKSYSITSFVFYPIDFLISKEYESSVLDVKVKVECAPAAEVVVEVDLHFLQSLHAGVSGRCIAGGSPCSGE